MRNSFFFVRTCASSSLNAEIVSCLSIRPLYHIWLRFAFSMRYCPKYYPVHTNFSMRKSVAELTFPMMIATMKREVLSNGACA